MKYYQRGFTLFEVLVVITIVGVLSATSIPLYNDLVVQAKYAQLDALLRDGRGAIEVGTADLEEHGGYESMIDGLSYGLVESVYVIVNQDGSTDDNILRRLAPSINKGMFKDPNTHMYFQWQPNCLRENYDPNQCMLYMLAAINCKFTIAHVIIQWRDNQGYAGAGKNFIIDYKGRFNRDSELTYGCTGDHLDLAAVAGGFDGTPDGKSPPDADAGDGDAGK